MTLARRHAVIFLCAIAAVAAIGAVGWWLLVPTGNPPPTREATWGASPTPDELPGYDLSKMVGTWRVHGESVVINADGTGADVWNLGPCNYDKLCTAHATLRLTSIANGIEATYVDVAVEDNTGKPPIDIGGEADRAGQSYLITYVRPGLLERRALGDLEPFSNPYLCNDETSALDQQKC